MILLFKLVAFMFPTRIETLHNNSDFHSHCVNVQRERLNVCEARIEDSSTLFLGTVG